MQRLIGEKWMVPCTDHASDDLAVAFGPDPSAVASPIAQPAFGSREFQASARAALLSAVASNPARTPEV